MLLADLKNAICCLLFVFVVVVVFVLEVGARNYNTECDKGWYEMQTCVCGSWACFGERLGGVGEGTRRVWLSGHLH